MFSHQVGHNALGAGKIIAQGAALVDIALETRTIFNDAGWQYIKPAFEKNTLHIITLLSSGGVHSRCVSSPVFVVLSLFLLCIVGRQAHDTLSSFASHHLVPPLSPSFYSLCFSHDAGTTSWWAS